MTSDERALQYLADANPIPDLKKLDQRSFDSVDLATTRRRTAMLTEERTLRDAPEPRRRRKGWAVALAAVFVVVAAGLGSWVLLGGGSDETPIASGIEGATFEVLFDGTTCTLAGPEVVPVGEYSFVMTDTADRAADGFEVRRFTEGHSYQDAAGLLAEDPYGSSPEWDLAVPFALDPRLELAENQQLLSFRLGEPGPHGVILRQGKGVEPFYVWACGGFEVSQWW